MEQRLERNVNKKMKRIKAQKKGNGRATERAKGEPSRKREIQESKERKQLK